MVDDVVEAWLRKVDVDLRSAHACLEAADPVLEGAAFHCQQAAEKLVKATLVSRGVHPPKIHDIEKLVHLLPAELRPQLAPLTDLTEFAVAFRYPAQPGMPAPQPPDAAEIKPDAWRRSRSSGRQSSSDRPAATATA